MLRPRTPARISAKYRWHITRRKRTRKSVHYSNRRKLLQFFPIGFHFLAKIASAFPKFINEYGILYQINVFIMLKLQRICFRHKFNIFTQLNHRQWFNLIVIYAYAVCKMFVLFNFS